uniref:Uncharacterized protein n=1 Tax=viral metagenome TaxID=1070528 RepID=A0A6C0HKK8_9ZZZZ
MAASGGGASVQLYADLVGLGAGLAVFAILAVSWFVFVQKRPMRSDFLVVLVLINVAFAAALIVTYVYRDTWILPVKN